METDNKSEEKDGLKVEVETAKENKKRSIGYWAQGHALEDLVVKQSLLLFLIFVLILMFITNRYWCSKQLTEMDKLKNELVRLNDDQVKLTSQLSQFRRQLQIEEALKENGIELKKNNSTIYLIKK